jgi:hypothetical protein
MGSHHVKLDGECYKLNENTLPFGYSEKGVGYLDFYVTLIVIGFLLLLWYHSKMKNQVFLGFSFVVALWYVYTLASIYDEKKRIVEEHGTKVKCEY